MALALEISGTPNFAGLHLVASRGRWRRLTRLDAEAIVAHFQALDESDRRRRFLGAAPLAVIETRYRTLDYARNTLIGVEEGGRLVALLEIYPDALGVSLEIALTVDGALQGAGVGGALVDFAIARAAETNGGVVCFECLSSNEGMLGLAEHRGFRVTVADGIAYGVLSTAASPARTRAS